MGFCAPLPIPCWLLVRLELAQLNKSKQLAKVDSIRSSNYKPREYNLIWDPILALRRLRRTHWCRELKGSMYMSQTMSYLDLRWLTGLHVSVTMGLSSLSACMRDDLVCFILATATHIVYWVMHFSLHSGFQNTTVTHSCPSESLGFKDLRVLKSLLWNGLILAYSQLLSSVDPPSFVDNP